MTTEMMYVATIFTPDKPDTMLVQSAPQAYRSKAVREAMRLGVRADREVFDRPRGAFIKVERIEVPVSPAMEGGSNDD